MKWGAARCVRAHFILPGPEAASDNKKLDGESEKV